MLCKGRKNDAGNSEAANFVIFNFTYVYTHVLYLYDRELHKNFMYNPVLNFVNQNKERDTGGGGMLCVQKKKVIGVESG